MAGYNKVILIGNLTRDPELRYTPKGTAIAKLGLAVNRTWRDEAGATKEEVTFVDLEAWGRQAETIGQYLKKGAPIMIDGRLRFDSWDDKQTNQKRSRLLVVVENFQFLGTGNRPTEDSANPQAHQSSTRQSSANPPAPAKPAETPEPPEAPAADSPVEEDDVPF